MARAVGPASTSNNLEGSSASSSSTDPAEGSIWRLGRSFGKDYLCLSPSTSIPLRDCWGIRDRLTLREGGARKHLKMEPCVLSKSRARSPYSYLREVEKLN